MGLSGRHLQPESRWAHLRCPQCFSQCALSVSARRRPLTFVVRYAGVNGQPKGLPRRDDIQFGALFFPTARTSLGPRRVQRDPNMAPRVSKMVSQAIEMDSRRVHGSQICKYRSNMGTNNGDTPFYKRLVFSSGVSMNMICLGGQNGPPDSPQRGQN